MFTLPVIGTGKKTTHPYPVSYLQLLHQWLEFCSAGNHADVAYYLARHACLALQRLVLQRKSCDGNSGWVISGLGTVADDPLYP